MRQTDRHFKFDWITILLFFILAGFGWLNILSASHTGEIVDYFNFTESYGKQLIFIILSVVLIILMLSIDAKFYERFSSIIYFASLLSLIGLFV
ncbi:FtsW/RodA/SpoVE family cell cycle protein, partial [Lacinutrix sp.]|uniref:FtsW/RodA/SpoVE family cell cycle protein n=1 Tax=Lacinutrix sp. TaxID=1937692 RepID=UPI0025B7E046